MMCFFCFKRKTAYELRISDWSSDVCSSDLHFASLEAVRGYSEETLAKPFVFVGRHFTVGGFLWAVYGHHCYHVGQVDQLMRQQSVMPPEFLEYRETEKLIA